MKNVFFLISILLFIYGCDAQRNKTRLSDSLKLDSESVAQTGKTINERAKEMTDSVIKSAVKKALLDTVGLYKAPVKMIKAKVVRVEYSNTKNVYLAYKNISNKTIKGIKFRWYGLNAFDEPAELGDYNNNGFGGGFSDDLLKPKNSDSGTWNVYSKDAKKIVIAWPYEVSFTDGTKWILNKNY